MHRVGRRPRRAARDGRRRWRRSRRSASPPCGPISRWPTASGARTGPSPPAQLRLLARRPVASWRAAGHRPPHGPRRQLGRGDRPTPRRASTWSGAASPCTGCPRSRRSTPSCAAAMAVHRRGGAASGAVAARPGGAGAPRSAPASAPPTAAGRGLGAAPRRWRPCPSATPTACPGATSPAAGPSSSAAGAAGWPGWSRWTRSWWTAVPTHDVAVGDEVVLIGEQGDESLTVVGLGRGARHHRPRGVLRDRVPGAACGRRPGGPTDERQATARTGAGSSQGVAAGTGAALAGGLGGPAPDRGPHPSTRPTTSRPRASPSPTTARITSSTSTTAAASTSSSAARARPWCCSTGSC